MFKIGEKLIRTAIRPESLYDIGSIVEVVNITLLPYPDIFGRPYRIQAIHSKIYQNKGFTCN